MNGVLLEKEIHVSSLEEAIELANQFKKERYFDWFRGQAKNWPLSTSFARKSKLKGKEELEKLNRFVNWVSSNSEIEYLEKKTDKMIAIAQHYGIATNFIDFTLNPEIAGFFASDAKWIRKGTKSCIICLNRNKTYELFSIFSKNRKIHPELLEFEVDNLWRLEAQEGKFLYSPFKNIEDFLSVTKILFPFEKGGNQHLRNKVYPSRKSILEILLDQYFNSEEVYRFHQTVKQFEDLKKYHLDDDYSEVREKLKSELNVHPSWNESNIKEWREIRKEKIPNFSKKITVNVKYNSDLSIFRDEIYDQIFQGLSNIEEVKSKLINWNLERVGDKRLSISTRYINKIWDGLRLTPFHLKEISYGLSNALVLQFISKKEKLDLRYSFHKQWKKICEALFGELIYIEMTSGDGSHTRCYIGKDKIVDALRDALREDLKQILKTEFDEINGELLENILLKMNEPKYIFNFQKLNSVFVTDAVPTQIIHFPLGQPVYYSAAKLEVFGIP